MKIVFLGATGMVGSGTLREALNDIDVETVLSVGRRSCGLVHPKLQELILPDLFEIGRIEDQLSGYDACIWALGISSAGMKEPEYKRITEDLTLLWARTLLRLNPTFSFCYCSAAGAGGRWMWARVRQRVENAVQKMQFLHAGAVRPGFIQPGPGISSRVRLYQVAIEILRPVFPLGVRLWPSLFTTSERLGRTMLRVVKGETNRFILESSDINRLAQ
ncbi:epimerase [Silvibacterium sp.]|uniref:epimerase n=1 Tax=Silvibacterium sp. TaxID=1964179 RepID=UPI0039E247D8